VIKILGYLSVSALKTARLVCRAFRTASISIVTHLSYDCRTAPESIDPLTLAHDLPVFTSLSKLDLHVTLPQCTAVLELPNVCSALCSLHLVKGLEELTSAQSLGALAPRLATATQLTTFWVEEFLLNQPDSGIPLAYALGACRGIQELRLGLVDKVEVAQAVLQVSTLRTLHCAWDGDESYETVIGNVSFLTRLQSLGVVSANAEVDCRYQGVAVLNQLTNLTFGWVPRNLRRLTQLSSLASLRVLSLDVCILHGSARTDYAANGGAAGGDLLA
jgi:hypothetical protein